MRRRIPRRTLLLLAAAVTAAQLLFVSVSTAEAPTERVVSGFRVALLLQEPFEAGTNVVRVHIEDSDGRAVRNAEVSLLLEPIEEEGAEAPKPAPKPKKSETKQGGMGGMGGASSSGEDDYEAPASDMGDQEAPASDMGDDEAAEDSPDAEDGDGAMPEAIELAPTDDPGTYRTELEFEEPGEWRASVRFEVEDVERTADFTIEVAEKEPNWAVLGGFLGVNSAIVLGAAVTRRRKAASKGMETHS